MRKDDARCDACEARDQDDLVPDGDAVPRMWRHEWKFRCAPLRWVSLGLATDRQSLVSERNRGQSQASSRWSRRTLLYITFHTFTTCRLVTA